MRELLIQAGYEVTGESSNGLQALTDLAAIEKFPDVILMDINMPLLNGLESARSIKATWPTVKIIIVSSDPQPEDKLIKYGLKHFIHKSLGADAFLGQFEIIVENLKQERNNQ